MTCYHPVAAWQRRSGGPLIFGAEPGAQVRYNPITRQRERYVLDVNKVEIGCNNCVGCKEEYARQWAVRCFHESLMHADNCFVTLTYDQDHDPGVLIYPHFQYFIDRLRKAVKVPVRYFVAGEYGEASGRPHFHACLFGYMFDDLVRFGSSPRGHQMYRSRRLELLWPAGFSTVQPFTFGTAKYCAKYAAKRLKGEQLDPVTGELKPPEFVNMSTKPGIGMSWLEKYAKEVYEARDGLVVTNGGHVGKAPRFYDKFFAKLDADRFAYIQQQRIKRAELSAVDSTEDRLLVRERVHLAQVDFFKKDGL